MFGFSVAARGKSGGLVLLWNKEIYVDLASFSSSHINARVRLSEESEPWRLTDFYGAPDANNHGESWTLLRRLSRESKLPWMCVGDFNVILLDLEKDGALPTRQWQLRAFREALIDCDLHDLSFLGFPFTWASNREYPHMRIYSDHAPILVEHTQKQKRRQARTNKPLKFKAMWIKSEDCEKVISRLWHNTSLGDPNDTFMRKLDTCRMGLISWSKVEFGEMTKRIREIEKEIGHIKSSVMTVNAKNKISTLEGELHKLLSVEELKWKQRGKSAWLAEVNPSEIELDEVIKTLPARVTDEMNQRLIEEYSTNEVKLAISQMFAFKSPGPDGMPPIFYQRFWFIVGHATSNCVLNMLNNHDINPSLNFTHILLIPKCRDPEFVSQFRPISLSNIVFKLASKLVANRLKPFLNNIISPSQSAFILGRLITDNVLVAFEINHFLNSRRGGREGHVSIKLDMSKAYDRIEWKYLEGILSKLGFHYEVVSLIMRCVSSVSYSFLLNESQFGFLSSGMGIRQGDSLSPYLFILCAEELSRMLQDRESRGEITRVAVAHNVTRVSHLLFADDTLIFCKATETELGMIWRLLETYGKASGQLINFDKSSIVFSSNTPQDTRNGLASALGIRIDARPQKYLGLPFLTGRNKREIFSIIRERV
ncbi:UNVERIFIED_CONTAM: hypothetical protein Scaly_2729500 [Sesamum calycinum]|uniref:Reverse transcriptase domain-containing protein n=1 Tax=Sesamum calycinum TaxID=2727403 RepID=A0AAW2J4L3_9LAMI